MLTGMYIADIKAIPDDKWTESFGGCTRPSNVLTADALSFLMWVTEAMKGNVLAGDEANLAAMIQPECDTKAGAIAKISAVSAEFLETLSVSSDDLLLSEVMAPFGMPAPLFGLAQMAVSHIWYHDGQLNYIQCLLGDEKVHWMGD